MNHKGVHVIFSLLTAPKKDGPKNVYYTELPMPPCPPCRWHLDPPKTIHQKNHQNLRRYIVDGSEIQLKTS